MQILWVIFLIFFISGPPDAFAQGSTDTSDLEAQVLQGSAPGKTEDQIPSALKGSSELEPVVEAEDDPLPQVDQDELEKVEEALQTPSEIPYSHIFVVQRRYIQKEDSHELTPAIFGIQPSDSFKRQLSWGMSYSYHFSEWLGVEWVHAQFITNMNTGLDDKILDKANVRVDRIEPSFSIGSALLWTPVKAKTAAKSEVHYFESYFSLGGGVTRYGDYFKPMAMYGLGFRFYFTKNSIMKTELRNYSDYRTRVIYRPTITLGFSFLTKEF